MDDLQSVIYATVGHGLGTSMGWVGPYIFLIFGGLGWVGLGQEILGWVGFGFEKVTHNQL